VQRIDTLIQRAFFENTVDFVIRYSAYIPSEQTMSLLNSLDTEYRELLDLRERVRNAEAAAMRPRPQKGKRAGVMHAGRKKLTRNR
jgi:hypothetical protein